MLPLFHPNPLLRNGHVQTCMAALLPRKIQTLRFEHILLKDGDILELHWLDAQDPTAPTVLLMHGMEGSVHSPYIQGMLNIIKQLGWRAAVLHMRGCQGRINLLPQCYHAGKTDDIELTLNHIKTHYLQSRQIFAIGYSLGGNQLLKFLGENPAQNFITAAVAVSIPFDLEACTRCIHQGFNQVYERRFLRSLKNTIEQKLQRNMDMPVSSQKLQEIKTLYDFDDQVTAPLHGFAGANEYYSRSSCGQFLSSIKTPTYILHAEDDPFIPKSVIPLPAQVSSAVTLNIQRYGGHVGFINLSLWSKPHYWLEKTIPLYLKNTAKI
ncbi:MAG: hydrolase [Gammaproteobacteria bacterium]